MESKDFDKENMKFEWLNFDHLDNSQGIQMKYLQ